MEIDVRKQVKDDVTAIRFAESAEGLNVADVIVYYQGDVDVWIESSCCSNETIGIRSKEDALNLIKALEKAIELNWLK
ncbi:hypothetical protein D3C86_1809870 [compost metagenome]